jgi:hypothetical protein|tara:strand:- start:334 stop:594 length:261 start_codon:yes stop_codon:yes gene_type:complete
MTTLALAKHFPRSKGCEQQANTFFNCFSIATETFLSDTNKSSEQTKNTILEGCKSELTRYDRCMVKALKKYPENYSRAGTAYRGRA